MSTYDTDLDSINSICSLVGEIVELTEDVSKELTSSGLVSKNYVERHQYLIRSKALTIKDKATCMEERLKLYKKGIEAMGFKRIKKKEL